MKVKLSKLMGKNPIVAYEDYTQVRLSRDSFLMVVACMISLGGFIHGFIIAQSQLLLTNDRFLLQMDTNYSDFSQKFVSVFYAGEMLGALCSFPLMDEIGRRKTLGVCCALCFLNLTWCAFISSPSNLLYSRFFVGMSVGGMINAAAVYISEISPHTQRGRAVAFLSFNSLLGFLLGTTVYYLVSCIHGLAQHDVGWRVALLVPLVALGTQIVTLFHLPDSPRWLLAKKTPIDCSTALGYFRRSNDTSREFSDIYRALSSDARLSDTFWDLLASPSIRLRLLLTTFLAFAQQFVGIHLVTLFGFRVLERMHALPTSGGPAQSLLLLLPLAAAGVAGSVMAFTQIDTLGRRGLLLVGSLVLAIGWLLVRICVLHELASASEVVPLPMPAPPVFSTEKDDDDNVVSTVFDIVNATGITNVTDSLYALSTALPSSFPSPLPTSVPSSSSPSLHPSSFPTSSSSLAMEDLPGSVNTSTASSSLFDTMMAAAPLTDWSDTVTHVLFALLLCVLSFAHAFSWGCVGWVYPAETFPYRARAKLNALMTCMHYFAAVLSSNIIAAVLAAHPFAMVADPATAETVRRDELAQMAHCFWLLCVGCVIAAVVVLIAVPETSGLALEEMEDLFRLEYSPTISSSSQSTASNNSSGHLLLNNSFCCCCLPTAPPLLGFRHLSRARAGLIGCSSTSEGASMTASTSVGPVSTPSGSSSSLYHSIWRAYQSYAQVASSPGSQTASSLESGHFAHEGLTGAGDISLAAGPIYEPSRLHKYSNEMREHRFFFVSGSSSGRDEDNEGAPLLGGIGATGLDGANDTIIASSHASYGALELHNSVEGSFLGDEEREPMEDGLSVQFLDGERNFLDSILRPVQSGRSRG